MLTIKRIDIQSTITLTQTTLDIEVHSLKSIDLSSIGGRPFDCHSALL